MGNMGRFEHGGDLYEFPDALDFSASLNPLGMPQSVKDALVANVDSFEAYPDPLCRNLVGAIAQHENVSTEHVVVTAGATDAFSRIVRVVKPGRILLPSPCFSGYEEATRGHDAVIVRHFLAYDNDYDMDEGFLDKLDESIDLVFLCNPNNPTGRAIDLEYVRQVCDRALACDAYVVLDECFAVLAGLPSGIFASRGVREPDRGERVHQDVRHGRPSSGLLRLRTRTCRCAARGGRLLGRVDARAGCRRSCALRDRVRRAVPGVRARAEGSPVGHAACDGAQRDTLGGELHPVQERASAVRLAAQQGNRRAPLRQFRRALRTKEENTALVRALREVLD